MTDSSRAAHAIELHANQPAERFYSGGSKIAEFRSLHDSRPSTPEDWVASTTTLYGESSLGLSTLPDGRLLRDAITADPTGWLGDEHVDAFGIDTMLLVKLLDAGQRLPVHIHPDAAFAAENLGAAHGKTEAWHILEGGEVYLGFTRDVTTDELRTWVDTQDVSSLLASMHRLEVHHGDFILVPAGLPHAIGNDVFLVELQEPEDFSILLEWEGFAIDGPAEGHLGLGFDTALAATDTRGWSEAEIEELVIRAHGHGTLPPAADPFFRAELRHVETSETFTVGFSVLVCLDGEASLSTTSGSSTPIARGSTLVLPHACGAITIEGEASILVCRPPSPHHHGDET